MELLGVRCSPQRKPPLTRLQKTRQLALASLHLNTNCIADNSAVVPANSLAGNTALKSLSLHNNGAIAATGWSSMVKLACDSVNADGVAT